MKKILHFGLSENRGGIETYLLHLVESLDKSMYKVDFIDTNLGTPCFYQEFSDLGCEFHKITPRRKSILKNYIEINNLAKNTNYDILHIHLNTLSYILPIVLFNRQGVKVILHSRNAGMAKSTLTNLLHFINKVILRKFKIEKIAVSKLAGDWLFGKNSAYSIINNGVDVEKYKFNISNRKKIRKENGFEDNDILIGHVGAFLPAKNHSRLIGIFDDIVKTNSNFKLILIGEGPDMGMIQRKSDKLSCSENIYFMGKQKNLEEWYSSFDMFLLPSLYEGFPNVIMEAQASGLPCIISDNVTNEVGLLTSTYYVDLNDNNKIWVNCVIDKSQGDVDREVAYKTLKKIHATKVDEIKKIIKLYEEV